MRRRPQRSATHDGTRSLSPKAKAAARSIWAKQDRQEATQRAADYWKGLDDGMAKRGTAGEIRSMGERYRERQMFRAGRHTAAAHLSAKLTARRCKLDVIATFIEPREQRTRHLRPSKEDGATTYGRWVANADLLTGPQKISQSYEQSQRRLTVSESFASEGLQSQHITRGYRVRCMHHRNLDALVGIQMMTLLPQMEVN
jgi:hypothetical protein